jgi:hypothetical protein
MRALETLDPVGFRSGNPFDTELIRSLELIGLPIDHGKFRLTQTDRQWDIVHFHWPELLMADIGVGPAALEWLESMLAALKANGSRMVMTVHNEAPHYVFDSRYDQLYRLMIAAMDGYIHLGPASESVVRQLYPAEVSDKPHVVIPHGHYAVYGEMLSKPAARKQLGLPEKPTALVLGSLRDPEEYKLCLEFAKGLAGSGRQLIFSGKLWYRKSGSSKLPKPLVSFADQVRPKWHESVLGRLESVVLRPGPIAYDQMRFLVSAADVVLIPRLKTLNSGTLPLGFTYGAVVLGPDTGNVGALLRSSSNPAFAVNERSAGQIKDYWDEAFASAEQGLGQKNRHLALDEWSWERIGVMHRQFYEELCSQSRRDNT